MLVTLGIHLALSKDWYLTISMNTFSLMALVKTGMNLGSFFIVSSLRNIFPLAVAFLFIIGFSVISTIFVLFSDIIWPPIIHCFI